jgi:hypothetical protein
MGNYSRRFIQLQWGGTLLAPQEIWSCGLKICHPTGDDAAGSAAVDALDLPALLNATVGLASAVVSYHTNPAMVIASAAKLTFVKANKIGVDGKYVEGNTYVAPIANLGGASVTDPRYPTQVSLAVSLTTGFSRGPAHRGRFYLPMPNLQMSSDGRLSQSDVQAAATRSKIFIDDINSLLAGVSSPLRVAVMSRKTGAPAQRAVSGVEIGRVLDTQRRRRSKMVEGHIPNA